MKKVFIALPIFIFVANSATISDADAEAYLKQFGYLKILPPPKGQNADFMKDYESDKKQKQQKALKQFQSFAGLSVTGKLDDATKAKMSAPRCSLADVDELRKGKASVWEKPVLTWKIKEFSRKMGQSDVRSAVARAFDIWSKVIPLDFLEAHPHDQTDMEVKFASGKHDDNYPFDGQGHTLAHAFYPKDGRIHFDADENWSLDRREIKEKDFTDFSAVATHEIGHSLGLTHVSDQDSVMLPYYLTPDDQGPRLSPGDVQRIQSLYGSRQGPRVRPPTTSGPKSQTPKSTTPGQEIPAVRGTPSKSCPDYVNAATTAANGRDYFFKEDVVYQVTPNGLVQSPVKSYFPKFGGSVDAAVTSTVNQLTLLFQGKKVFAYEWDSRDQKFDLHPDFPKNLPPEVPFSPEWAFRWTDGNTVLVKAPDFVIYDENYNKPTMVNKMKIYFSDIPSDAIGVFSIKDDIMIVDKNSRIKKISDIQKKIDSGLTLKQLLHC